MKPRAFHALAVAAFTTLASGVFLWWAASAPAVSLRESQPGEDGSPAGRVSGRGAGSGQGGLKPAELQTGFIKFSDLKESLPGEWPGFRGPDRDNVVKDAPELTDLLAGKPRVLWEVRVGEGHAGAAVSDGRVYLLDYIEAERADALRCFSLADGGELWRRSYPVTLKRNHGFSRTVPSIQGPFVVTMGPSGTVMCVDKTSGDLRWVMPLVDRYDGAVPPWYTGQCPLIDNGQVILSPGGSAIMIGVDLASGKVIWETPNPDGWAMSHSSIMKYELDGAPAYLYAAIGGLIAVSASDSDRGAVLWKSAAWNEQVVAPSPLAVSGSEIFLTAGYGAGSMALKVEGGKTRVLFSRGPDRGMASEQQTPIVMGGFLIGILPKDAGEMHNQLVCMTLNGSVAWSSGKTDRFGLGPYLIADGKLFILDDDGRLTAVRASTRSYEKLGQVELMDGRGVDAWAPMALAGSRLILRDSTRLMCVEMGIR